MTRPRNAEYALHYLIGVSLGRGGQPTSVAVLEQEAQRQERWSTRNNALRLGHLARLPLGTSYPCVVDQVRMMFDRLRPNDDEKAPTVLVDITGVGVAALPLFRDAGFEPMGVTISGAAGEERVPDRVDEWRVSRFSLIGCLQVNFETGRLRIAEALPEGAKLKTELAEFKIRQPPPPKDSSDAWRSAPQDDLVFAAALCAWWAESHVPMPKAARDAQTQRIEEHFRKYGRGYA